MTQIRDYPQPYIEYLIEFHGTRDYFECHEIMEEFWKENIEDEHRHLWLGLIQIAVGLYHHRTGNVNGALKMMSGALKQLSQIDGSIIAIDREPLVDLISNRIAQLSTNTGTPEKFASYTDFNLPLTDEALIRHCQSLCAERQLHWCAPSDVHNRELIYRHTLRDRSDVIAARHAAYQAKHSLEGSK